MAGCIDDVDGVVFPGAGCCGRGNRDAALLLLLHPVHGGCALVDFTDLVVDSRVKQDALGCRGFARVDMSHDPDIADLGQIECGLGRHVALRCSRLSGKNSCWWKFFCLPAVMGKSLIGFGHLVGIFALLDASAKTV
ncbi:unannotated protein [freshwater metagenome]|uniref:Unannotated protein n=1 Tax=freshwater metagenome TaxID=449393 RepID=A0A6J6ZVP1_9ZZZZ